MKLIGFCDTVSHLQRRTARDRLDLMTFKEIRERLANRDVIREKQEIEERAEAERDREAEKAARDAHERRPETPF